MQKSYAKPVSTWTKRHPKWWNQPPYAQNASMSDMGMFQQPSKFHWAKLTIFLLRIAPSFQPWGTRSLPLNRYRLFGCPTWMRWLWTRNAGSATCSPSWESTARIVSIATSATPTGLRLRNGLKRCGKGKNCHSQHCQCIMRERAVCNAGTRTEGSDRKID